MSFIKETLLLLLVTLLLLVPLPVKYSWFELKEGQKPDAKPPAKECSQICLGKVEDKSCTSYSKKYRQCEAKCSGLLYDGCLGWEGSLEKKLACAPIIWIAFFVILWMRWSHPPQEPPKEEKRPPETHLPPKLSS